jgi:hypothetical protein
MVQLLVLPLRRQQQQGMVCCLQILLMVTLQQALSMPSGLLSVHG